MEIKIKKFTVSVTKTDGAMGAYHVLALSAGGAEKAVLSGVFQAKYALAVAGWPEGVKADLISQGAAEEAVRFYMTVVEAFDKI